MSEKSESDSRPQHLMLKTESIARAILAFVYGSVGVFLVCLANPVGGPLKAFRGRSRFPGPVTTLVLAAALLTLSSLSGPDILPNLIARNERPISTFVVYLLTLYVFVDVALNISAAAIHRIAGRSKASSTGLMRYSAAALLFATFVIATIATAPVVLAGAGDIPFLSELEAYVQKPYVRVVLDAIAIAPLLTTVLLLTRRRRRWGLRGVTAAGVSLVVLALAACLGNAGIPRVAYSFGRFLVPDKSPTIMGMSAVAEEAKSPAALAPTRKPDKLRIDPLICSVSSDGTIHVDAALNNDADTPVAIDAGAVYLRMFEKGWSMADPKSSDAAVVFTKDRLLAVGSRSAELLSGSANFQDRMSRLDLASAHCWLVYHEAGREQLFADSSSRINVLDAQPQAARAASSTRPSKRRQVTSSH